MMVGNFEIRSTDWRIRLFREVSSGFSSKVYISNTLRARIFMMFWPSRSRMFILVFWVSGMHWCTMLLKAASSSLSGR